MGRYLAGRLAGIVLTLWLLATAGFLLIELIPGDPARQLAGPAATTQSVEAIREAYGFDRPFLERYAEAMGRLTTGDLGESFSRNEPVTSVVARGLGPTLKLTGLAFLGEVLIGVPLALWVVSRRGRVADRLLVAAAGATSAIPAFLVGLILLYFLAFRLGWFALGGSGPLFSLHTPLPVLSVAVPFGLVFARILRTTLLDEQEQAYATFALARGETARAVRWRHLLPNALLPLLSVLALDFAGLFSSVAVVEVAFSLEGLGADLFDAIRRLDTALIIGIALLGGLVVTLVNLLADVAVLVLDPRARR